MEADEVKENWVGMLNMLGVVVIPSILDAEGCIKYEFTDELLKGIVYVGDGKWEYSS